MPDPHDPGGHPAADHADTLELNLNRPGVRRLSPRMIAALGLVLAVVLMTAFVIGFNPRHRISSDRNATDANVTPASENVIDTALTRLPEDYTFDPRDTEEPSYGEPQEATTQAAETTPPHPEMDPTQAALLEARQRQLERLRKQHEEAIDSPVVFAKLQRVAAAAMHQDTARGSTASDESTTSTRNPRDLALTADGFLARTQPASGSSLIEAASLYTVHAGTVLPGALVTAIHSDLPGVITGQVTEHVYDPVTGRHLLVPQGSRLIGRYSSLVGAGQNRVLVAWDRLILPNGDSIDLDTMPGTDALGRAGLADRVDYHVGRIGLATALSTVIAYAGNLANPRNDADGSDGATVVGETVAQQASQLGQRIIDRELDLPPTVTIRPGTRFHVLVHDDLVLQPYPRPQD